MLLIACCLLDPLTPSCGKRCWDEICWSCSVLPNRIVRELSATCGPFFFSDTPPPLLQSAIPPSTQGYSLPTGLPAHTYILHTPSGRHRSCIVPRARADPASGVLDPSRLSRLTQRLASSAHTPPSWTNRANPTSCDVARATHHRETCRSCANPKILQKTLAAAAGSQICPTPLNLLQRMSTKVHSHPTRKDK